MSAEMRLGEAILILASLLMVIMGGLFFSESLRLRETTNENRKLKREILEERSTVFPESRSLHRHRRGFRSYFYNYLDELAMGICASLPSEGPGLVYAVRRTCTESEASTCKEVCMDEKLKEQAPKEVQRLAWVCSESLHVYKRQPALADNYEEYVDSNKLGLAVYRHNSCNVAKCGPNYCCCRAVASASSLT